MPVNKKRAICRAIFPVLLVLSFTGCGGGGGGDAPPQELVYSGNTNSAVITLENATTLVGNVLYGGEAGSNIPVAVMLTEDKEPRSAGAVVQSKLLHGISQNIQDSIFKNNASLPNLVVGVDFNEPLECDSGSGNLAGTLDDTTFTGTLTFTYVNCLLGGTTYNGTGTFRVDAIDLYIVEITDATMTFTLLSISSPEFTGSISGSIRIQSNIHMNTETTTLNYITKDDISGKMYKFEDVVITAVYDYIFYPSTKAVTYTGAPARVYDSAYGYVDVDTLTPLTYSSPMLDNPDIDGVMLFKGAAGSSIRVTVLPGDLIQLELDIDGIYGYEESRILLWEELAVNANTDLTGTDSIHVLHIPLSGTGQASSGLDSNSYYGQTFILEESGTAERLTVYLSNTLGIDFRILLVEVQTVPDFRPTIVLSESVTLSAPAAAMGELKPVTASLGSIKLNAGQAYAFILDGYVEYDGSLQSAYVATINSAYPGVMSFTASVSSGTRDEHFLNSFWYTDTLTDISFVLEYKPD